VAKLQRTKPSPNLPKAGPGTMATRLVVAPLAHFVTFRQRIARLHALFDVSEQEVGDPYLMQEVLDRSGRPNRGNKAQCTYLPILVAYLAGIAPTGETRHDLIPDLRVNHPTQP